MSASIRSIPVYRIDGTGTTLAAFAGRAVLIVNVASKCGSCAILVQAALVLGLRISDRDDSPRGHQSWAEKSHLCHLCWPSPRF
jgi:hypothetical protein